VEREAMLEERDRLIRELHDTVGYTMMNQIMMMEVGIRLAGDSSNQGELVELLHQSRRQAQDGLNEARRAMHILRESSYSQMTGIEAIKKLVKAFEKTEVEVKLDLRNVTERSFNEQVDSILYHVIQEGITNALRHGRATAIDVSFWISEDAIILTVSDNGQGSPELKPGIGLLGIERQLQSIKGSLKTASSSMGFSLIVTIPWKEARGVGDENAEAASVAG
jgi:signal transduction histidine kinase